MKNGYGNVSNWRVLPYEYFYITMSHVSRNFTRNAPYFMDMRSNLPRCTQSKITPHLRFDRLHVDGT